MVNTGWNWTELVETGLNWLSFKLVIHIIIDLYHKLKKYNSSYLFRPKFSEDYSNDMKSNH